MTDEDVAKLYAHEQVEKFGYFKAFVLDVKIERDYPGGYNAEQVTILRCPRCAALVDDHWLSGGATEHMYWHEPSWR